jgi:hypothetical protein
MEVDCLTPRQWRVLFYLAVIWGVLVLLFLVAVDQ